MQDTATRGCSRQIFKLDRDTLQGLNRQMHIIGGQPFPANGRAQKIQNFIVPQRRDHEFNRTRHDPRQQKLRRDRRFDGQNPRRAKGRIDNDLLHRRPSSMRALTLNPFRGLVRERMARKAATGSLPLSVASAAPEESNATRRPLFVIQIRLPLEARSTSAESLFLASKVPNDIMLEDSIQSI